MLARDSNVYEFGQDSNLYGVPMADDSLAGWDPSSYIIGDGTATATGGNVVWSAATCCMADSSL